MMLNRQLVQDTRRPVIPRHVSGIVSGRLFVAAQFLRNITQSFERAGSLGGEHAGPGQVPQRGRQVASTVVGLTAFQVGKHAIALQRDSAAEGLEGEEDLVLTERFIPGGDETAILGVAGHSGIQEDPGHRRHQQHADREPLHVSSFNVARAALRVVWQPASSVWQVAEERGEAFQRLLSPASYFEVCLSVRARSPCSVARRSPG